MKQKTHQHVDSRDWILLQRVLRNYRGTDLFLDLRDGVFRLTTPQRAAVARLYRMARFRIVATLPDGVELTAAELGALIDADVFESSRGFPLLRGKRAALAA